MSGNWARAKACGLFEMIVLRSLIINNLISDFEKKRKELPESKLYLTAPNSIEFDPIEHIASNL
jgi:hypothetical protein